MLGRLRRWWAARRAPPADGSRPQHPGTYEAEKWRLKQELAKPARYYGDGGTIHRRTTLDVETYHGIVVGIWFRCQPLPYTVSVVDEERLAEMARDYAVDRVQLTGVEVLDGTAAAQ